MVMHMTGSQLLSFKDGVGKGLAQRPKVCKMFVVQAQWGDLCFRGWWHKGAEGRRVHG